MTGETLTVRIALTMPRDQGGPFVLDVAFDAPPGITVLFGPSGAGKSSTLACVAGIKRPDRGRITLGDCVWFDAEARTTLPIHERRAAYLFQTLALFPHMTAAENVAFGISRALPRTERRARAVQMLETMRVAHLEKRKPATFSGGEAQRVAIARAFAMRPRALLLDEPFSALDAAVKAELHEEVRAFLAEERIPTLLVTHQPDEARALGDRVVFVEGGRVIRTAPIADAFA
jgi:molybdate transport system ATP-binding protein